MSRRSSAALGVMLLTAALGGALACTKTESYYVDDPDEDDETKEGDTTTPSPDSGLGILTFRPEKAYSGFDGQHTFKVPVAVYDSADDLEVRSTDTSAAEIVPVKLAQPRREDGTVDNGKYFMVTVKRAGTITLQATSKGRTVEATITVTSYDPGRWQTGEQRYKNGLDDDNPACTNCHVNGEAIDHSPAALATVKDDELAAVITSGISTAGFPIKIDGQPGHRWTVPEGQLDGLVTYLRGLEPRGFK